MENASKALLIAGGVLIAIMVISILVLSYNKIKGYNKEKLETTRVEQAVKFNEEYGTYATKNLRGNELLSLINKVINYNERKSTEGWEGAEIAYSPIKVTINFAGKKEKLSFDTTNNLIKNNKYEQSDTNNALNYDILRIIYDIEAKYTSSSIQQLASNITAIFLETGSAPAKQDYAFNKFKEICPKINNRTLQNYGLANYSDLRSKDSEIYLDVRKYYEYMQLKKALFDGLINGYNENTGRISEMTFTFTGTIR